MKILVFISIILLTSLFSCGNEYKMKQEFKDCFIKTMHNPDSYELIHKTILKESYSYSEKNKLFMDSIGSSYDSNKTKQQVFIKLSDSIRKLEDSLDNDFIYKIVLFEIRGENGFGALRLSQHIAKFHSDYKLSSIDGNICF